MSRFGGRRRRRARSAAAAMPHPLRRPAKAGCREGETAVAPGWSAKALGGPCAIKGTRRVHRAAALEAFAEGAPELLVAPQAPETSTSFWPTSRRSHRKKDSPESA